MMTSPNKTESYRLKRPGWWIAGGLVLGFGALAWWSGTAILERSVERAVLGSSASGSPTAALLKGGSATGSAATSRTAQSLALPIQVLNPTLSLITFVPNSAVILAQGTEGSVLRSQDDGKTWNHVDTHTREFLTGSAVHAATNAVIIAGSRGTLLRSSNTGETFEKIPVPTERAFRAVATANVSGQILAVGDDGMAFASNDGGLRFSAETSGSGSYLSNIVSVPGMNRFVIGGDHGTILVRDESGRYRVAKSPAQMLITAMDANLDGSIVAASQDGYLLRSSDAGETFVEVHKMREDQFVIGFDTNSTGTVLLGRLRTREILSSSDQGRHFTQLPFEPKQGLSKLVWVEGQGFVGLGLQGAIVSSGVDAKQWTIRRVPALTNPATAAIHPNSKTLIAVGASGLIARSTDQGRHFDVVRSSFGGLLRALAWDAARDCIVASGFDATILHSEDGGAHWVRSSVPIDEKSELNSLVFEPRSGAFVAAGAAGSILRSVDCGQRWSVIPIPNRKAIHGLLALGDGIVLAIPSEGAILRSADGALGFVTTDMDNDASLRRAVAVGESQVVAVGNDGRIYRSADSGLGWQRIASNTAAHLRAIHFDPATRTTWAVGDSGTVLKSTDRGSSWSLVSVPTAENLFVIGLNSADGLVLVGGNRGTVLRSDNQGRTFELLDSGSTQTIRTIALDPQCNEFLVAGVGGTLLRTAEGKRLIRIPGSFVGRMDVALFHPPSGTMILGGDRLYRIGGK